MKNTYEKHDQEILDQMKNINWHGISLEDAVNFGSRMSLLQKSNQRLLSLRENTSSVTMCFITVICVSLLGLLLRLQPDGVIIGNIIVLAFIVLYSYVESFLIRKIITTHVNNVKTLLQRLEQDYPLPKQES